MYLSRISILASRATAVYTPPARWQPPFCALPQSGTSAPSGPAGRDAPSGWSQPAPSPVFRAISRTPRHPPCLRCRGDPASRVSAPPVCRGERRSPASGGRAPRAPTAMRSGKGSDSIRPTMAPKGNCIFFPRRESVPPRRVVRSILRTRVARRVRASRMARPPPAYPAYRRQAQAGRKQGWRLIPHGGTAGRSRRAGPASEGRSRRPHKAVVCASPAEGCLSLAGIVLLPDGRREPVVQSPRG